MDKKYIIAGVLVLVIVSLLAYILLHLDTGFNQQINITFQDGCIETYNSGKLVTPICENGRDLRDQMIKEVDPDKWKEIHNLT